MKPGITQQGGVLMRSPSPRRFTLIDAIVLIAATAIALVPIRYILGDFQFPETRTPGDLVERGAELSVILEPLAMMLSLALWLLRLRRPRPRLRRIFRQPGTAAGTTIIVCTLGVLCMFLTIVLMNYITTRSRRFVIIDGVSGELESFFVLLSFAGFPVSCVWIALRLAGVWRAEPSWIDRTGRVLGIYWVLNSVIAAPLVLS
jgi:hypothetical protein